LNDFANARDYYAALYAPRASELAKDLPRTADLLHGRLCALSAHPSPDAAAELAANLVDAERAVRRLQAALLREA
jgi:hypothetical protein